jgi:glycerophosphoryl diester phosphodiesterase
MEIYSHRGGAGLNPENTLPAYIYSIELGVDALDIDVAITKDNIVVGSHDLFLNKDFTRDINKQWLLNNKLLIHDLTFEELNNYDVGRINPTADYFKKYPKQIGLDGVKIPSLAELVELIKKSQKKIKLQIEIKTTPAANGQVFVENFVDQIISVLKKHNFLEFAELQSFDWRALIYAKKQISWLKTAFITEDIYLTDFALDLRAGHKLQDYKNSLPFMIKKLGGSIWCPEYTSLSPEIIEEAHNYNLRVVTWTVNDSKTMQVLDAMGVDGIITDRPDILKCLL